MIPCIRFSTSKACYIRRVFHINDEEQIQVFGTYLKKLTSTHDKGCRRFPLVRSHQPAVSARKQTGPNRFQVLSRHGQVSDGDFRVLFQGQCSTKPLHLVACGTHTFLALPCSALPVDLCSALATWQDQHRDQSQGLMLSTVLAVAQGDYTQL